MVNPYIGHSSQLSGVEELRFVGGKGDGMRLLWVRNGRGLELTVSADRCADISRLSFKGDNMGYFSPCGYVAPAYYDKDGNGFLKSFTAGFLTTCGLTNLGAPAEDNGELLPQHGTVANIPCEHIWWREDDERIEIHAVINDSVIFSHKLVLERTISVSKKENSITIADSVTNTGGESSPLMLMYHMNIGYPLLSENAAVDIPSARVVPTTARAAEDVDTCTVMLKPVPGFTEQCYMHEFDEGGFARVYNPDINKGLAISFDNRELPVMCQWKMMGVREYVLGLEPRNVPMGTRKSLRDRGRLPVLAPGESKDYRVRVDFFE